MGLWKMFNDELWGWEVGSSCVMFASFHGVSTLTRADFKLPVWSLNTELRKRDAVHNISTTEVK